VESTSRRPFRFLKPLRLHPVVARVLSKTPRPSQPGALIQTLSGTLFTIVPPTGHRGSPTIVNAFGSGVGWGNPLGGMFCRYSWFRASPSGSDPLGDEGDVCFTVTLTTTVSGRTFVRGLQLLGSVGSMLLLLYRTRFGLFSPFNTTGSRQHCWQPPSCGVFCIACLPQPEPGFPGLAVVSAGRAQNIPPAELDGEYIHGIIVFGFRAVRCAVVVPSRRNTVYHRWILFDGSLPPWCG